MVFTITLTCDDNISRRMMKNIIQNHRRDIEVFLLNESANKTTTHLMANGRPKLELEIKTA